MKIKEFRVTLPMTVDEYQVEIQIQMCPYPYLIFVFNATNMFVEKKVCHVEKFFHMRDCNVEIFSCDKLSWIKSSPHKKYETNL